MRAPEKALFALETYVAMFFTCNENNWTQVPASAPKKRDRLEVMSQLISDSALLFSILQSTEKKHD
jgi:hypothetical protein